MSLGVAGIANDPVRAIIRSGEPGRTRLTEHELLTGHELKEPQPLLKENYAASKKPIYGYVKTLPTPPFKQANHHQRH